MTMIGSNRNPNATRFMVSSRPTIYLTLATTQFQRAVPAFLSATSMVASGSSKVNGASSSGTAP